MADRRVCKKCTQNVDAHTEQFTVCEGECACLFHANCVGLSEDDLCTFALKTNIIWMCDECMVKFRRMSGGTWLTSSADSIKGKAIDDEIRDLKTTVAGILETLSKLAATPVLNDRAPLHSTPVSTNMQFDEMTTSDTDASNVGNEQQSSQYTERDDFSLFISNIDSSVSERDIQRMVCLALNTPDPEHIDVSKLVSKWNNSHPPDFISFKVTLNKKWKDQAMNPLIWPKYVKFREFFTRHNVTWRPEH